MKAWILQDIMVPMNYCLILLHPKKISSQQLQAKTTWLCMKAIQPNNKRPPTGSFLTINTLLMDLLQLAMWSFNHKGTIISKLTLREIKSIIPRRTYNLNLLCQLKKSKCTWSEKVVPLLWEKMSLLMILVVPLIIL